MSKNILTQERLKEVLDYDEFTGTFTWKVSMGQRGKIGTVAGGKHHKGYYFIQYDGVRSSTHRLAFLYMTGSIPQEVDHIDKNPSNCAWSNLRSCTRTQNQANKSKQTNNTTGLVGVSRASRETKQGRRYEASISKDGKCNHLGSYLDPLNAAITRDMEALRLYGEFAILNNYPGDLIEYRSPTLSETISTVNY